MEQVLDRARPGDLLDFMLATSIVDTVCGPLADAMTGGTDSARRLAEIERANVFITPLDERREWYRYHGLLAELLRIELERRAARHGCRSCTGRRPTGSRSTRDMDRAVRHAIAAGDMRARRPVDRRELPPAPRGWPDRHARRLARLRCGPDVVAADQRLGGRQGVDQPLPRPPRRGRCGAGRRDPGAGACRPLPDGTGSIEATAALIGAAFPGNDAGRMLACAARAFELEAARDSPWRVTVHVLLGFALVRSARFEEAREPLQLGAELACANGPLDGRRRRPDAAGPDRARDRRDPAGPSSYARDGRRPRRGTRPRLDPDVRLCPVDRWDDPRPARRPAAGAGELLAGRCRRPGARRAALRRRVADQSRPGPPDAGRRAEAVALLREADAIIDSLHDPGDLIAMRHSCRAAPAAGGRPARLSRREVEVLQGVAKGASKRQAATSSSCRTTRSTRTSGRSTGSSTPIRSPRRSRGRASWG